MTEHETIDSSKMKLVSINIQTPNKPDSQQYVVMKKHEIIELSEIKLVGISIQNSNKPNLEESIKPLSEMAERYYRERLKTKITNMNNPGFPVAVYTNYEIEESPFAPYCEAKGEYRCFYGEQVTHFEDIKEGLEVLTIPAQTYVKFSALYSLATWEKIIPALWQEIWKMDSSELGGERTYLTDFEIYDEANDIVEIHVGIKNN